MNKAHLTDGEKENLRNEPKAPRASLLPDEIELERLKQVLEVRKELDGVSVEDILRDDKKEM